MELGWALKRALTGLFSVDVAANGADGLHASEVNPYDVILLDLSLPDTSGLNLCHELRKNGSRPIIVVTASDNVSDKITLLDSGADDYVTKPFSIEELKARIRASTRKRIPNASTSVLKVKDLNLHMATRQVSRSGVSIDLRKKEYDLLLYLMRHAGTVVTRPMITEAIWESNDGIWTNAVDVHIKYLRDKVDKPFGDTLIKTVHGVGYKLES